MVDRSACAGVDPIICQVIHEDCVIVQTSAISFDTVTRDVVVDLALRPGGETFLANREFQCLARPGNPSDPVSGLRRQLRREAHAMRAVTHGRQDD